MGGVGERYLLFDIEKLSEVEKDIILILGDDIYNIPAVNVEGSNARTTRKTIELLLQEGKYKREDIFKGFSLLFLKDIIEIYEYVPGGLRNTRDIYYKNNREYNSYIEFLYYIHSRLKNIQNYLNDNEDMELIYQNQDVSIYSKIVIGLIKDLNYAKEKETGEGYKKIEALITILDEYKDKKEIKDRDYLINNIQIAKMYIRFINLKDKPDLIIEKIAEYYLSESKIFYNNNIVFLSNFFIEYGISGTIVYNHLFSMIVRQREKELYMSISSLEEEIEGFHSIVDDIRNDIKESQEEIKRQVTRNSIRNIETISIFVAIITLIIGNVSFLPQISSKTTLGAIGLILIINGCLLVGTLTLTLVISKLVSIEIKIKKGLSIIISIFLILMLISGAGLAVWDIYSLKTEVKVEQGNTSPGIQNGLTIENNISSTNEGVQPAVTISPEVSSIVQSTPTPTQSSAQVPTE